ncbi:MAG TPA: hypothetical protein PLJ21_05265 [Pseudobdellovibrionaceae bacterium]|nr:hypothetical protein [Pseudobdellovibrionaceae bacterium]
MGFYKLLSTAFLAIFLTANQGLAIQTEAFKGQIHNYTQHPSEDLQMSIFLSCTTSDFMAPGSGCGFTEVKFVPNPDGSFEVPALSVNSALFGENEFKLMISPKQNHSLDKMYSVQFDKKQINKKKYLKLKNISIFGWNMPQVVNLGSGVDPKDLYLEYKFNFPNKSSESPVVFENTLFQVNPLEISQQWFYFLGEVAPSLNAEIHLKVKHPLLGLLFEKTSPFQLPGKIPEDMLSVDLPNHDLPVLYHSIKGAWKFHGQLPNEMSGDGIIQTVCENGVLKGQLQLEDPGAKYPITGSCQGDQAVGQVAGGTFYVERTQYNINKHNEYWVGRSSFNKIEFSSVLHLYDAENNKIGEIQAQRIKE